MTQDPAVSTDDVYQDAASPQTPAGAQARTAASGRASGAVASGPAASGPVASVPRDDAARAEDAGADEAVSEEAAVSEETALEMARAETAEIGGGVVDAAGLPLAATKPSTPKAKPAAERAAGQPGKKAAKPNGKATKAATTAKATPPATSPAKPDTTATPDTTAKLDTTTKPATTAKAGETAGSAKEPEPSVDELAAQVRQDRDALAETVAALAAKADVKARASEKAHEVKTRAADKISEVKAKAAEKVEDVKAFAADKAYDVRDKLHSTTDEAVGRSAGVTAAVAEAGTLVADRAEDVAYEAAATAGSLRERVRRNPLPYAVGAGALLAAIIFWARRRRY